MAAVILCIDDEPIVLMVRGLVLSQAGYQPVLANTAKEALELFASRRIDLVITDHLLPGQSGAQLAADLKRIRPDIPVMLLSGLPEPPERVVHGGHLSLQVERRPFGQLLRSLVHDLFDGRTHAP